MRICPAGYAINSDTVQNARPNTSRSLAGANHCELNTLSQYDNSTFVASV